MPGVNKPIAGRRSLKKQSWPAFLNSARAVGQSVSLNRSSEATMERALSAPKRLAHRLASLVAAAVVAASSTAALADADTIPRLPNGRPDFSGIWETLSAAEFDLEPHSTRKDAPPSAGVVEGGVIPYLPEALKKRQQNFERRHIDDPRLKCWTLGTPRGIYYREPFQIFQRDRDLTIVFQFGHSVRTIHTNGTGHPLETGQEFWMGDSRGHWEGDTLVVDVVDFTEETWLDRSGNFHSTDLHVVERWKFIDANTIEYRATLEDPKVFSRPWTLSVLLHRHREPKFQLIENYCFTLDYDQYYPPKKD
jgi:hypothetical protein